MPLTMAEIGKVSVINRVNGNEETRRFLGNLGFVAGTEGLELNVDSAVRTISDYLENSWTDREY